MHSSRMYTTCSSSCHGGLHTPREQVLPWSRHPPEQAPPGTGTPLGAAPRSRNPCGQIPLNFPLGCGPGTRSPSISPLAVGLETPRPDPPKLPPWVCAWKPARHAGIPPLRPAARHAGIPPAMHAGIAPPCGQSS